MVGQFGRELARLLAGCILAYLIGYMQVHSQFSGCDPEEGPLCTFLISVELPPDPHRPRDVHHREHTETGEAAEGRIPPEGGGGGRGGRAQGRHAQ